MSATLEELTREFLSAARETADQVLSVAVYIQSELPRLHVDDTMRRQLQDLCSVLIGTKHDLVDEIHEIEEFVAAGESGQVVRAVERISNWLREDALKMNAVVDELKLRAEKDVMSSATFILVSESAVNILRPLGRMLAGGAMLRSDLQDGKASY